MRSTLSGSSFRAVEFWMDNSLGGSSAVLFWSWPAKGTGSVYTRSAYRRHRSVRWVWLWRERHFRSGAKANYWGDF
jgi:hypothetical protein